MNGKGSVYSVLEWFGALAHTCDLGTRITQKYNSRKSSETKAAVTKKIVYVRSITNKSEKVKKNNGEYKQI